MSVELKQNMLYF